MLQFLYGMLQYYFDTHCSVQFLYGDNYVCTGMCVYMNMMYALV